MNKPNAQAKSQGKSGNYITKNGTVLFDDGKNQCVVMMGHAYADRFVFDPSMKTTTCAIVIEPYIVGAMPCMIRVEMATLSNAKALNELLGKRGVIVCHAAHASKYLIESAASVAKLVMRELVRNPRWVAQHSAFFTGQKLISGGTINASDYWVESSRASPMRAHGTLAKWREMIGAPIEANPIILAMTCIGMASIFLGRLGLSSSLYNFWGQKGTGKTLAEQCAASVFGNAVDPAQGAQVDDPAYIARFNGTLNGFEVLLGMYSPLPMMLDEMTEGSASIVYGACYMMASGEGKHRMTSGGEAAVRERWQTNIIVSAEVSIVDAISLGGKAMHGGQSDRAIDIPINGVGILTDYGHFGSFNAATSHLKRACTEQYGTAGEAIIQYCCDNPEQVEDLLAMAPDVEQELLPPDCGAGERRVVKRFAGAVVAGRIAVMAGVFDEAALEKIEEAIRMVLALWWEARAGSLARIRTFLDANTDEIHFGKPSMDQDVVAFVDDDITVFPLKVFNREFGEDGDATRMLDELAGLNALKTEQAGRRVHRFCNNSFRGYAILTKKLWPECDQIAA
jgi:putative DNA primase/helicase